MGGRGERRRGKEERRWGRIEEIRGKEGGEGKKRREEERVGGREKASEANLHLPMIIVYHMIFGFS